MSQQGVGDQPHEHSHDAEVGTPAPVVAADDESNTQIAGTEVLSRCEHVVLWLLGELQGGSLPDLRLVIRSCSNTSPAPQLVIGAELVFTRCQKEACGNTTMDETP